MIVLLNDANWTKLYFSTVEWEENRVDMYLFSMDPVASSLLEINSGILSKMWPGTAVPSAVRTVYMLSFASFIYAFTCSISDAPVKSFTPWKCRHCRLCLSSVYLVLLGFFWYPDIAGVCFSSNKGELRLSEKMSLMCASALQPLHCWLKMPFRWKGQGSIIGSLKAGVLVILPHCAEILLASECFPPFLIISGSAALPVTFFGVYSQFLLTSSEVSHSLL